MPQLRTFRTTKLCAANEAQHSLRSNEYLVNCFTQLKHLLLSEISGDRSHLLVVTDTC
jgi:hypothetical protein